MTIPGPLKALSRKPSEEDDLEKQLSPMAMDACTSQAQSGEDAPRKPPEALLPERDQDGITSRAQLRRNFEDAVTTDLWACMRKVNLAKKGGSKTGPEIALDNEGFEFVPEDERVLLHCLRRDQLHRVLDPLFSTDSSTLLLCGGHEDRCRIVPVEISDSADSVAQWNKAQCVWNQQNAIWRSWLPWYGVKNVVVGKVRLCPLSIHHGPLLILIRFK